MLQRIGCLQHRPLTSVRTVSLNFRALAEVNPHGVKSGVTDTKNGYTRSSSLWPQTSCQRAPNVAVDLRATGSLMPARAPNVLQATSEGSRRPPGGGLFLLSFPVPLPSAGMSPATPSLASPKGATQTQPRATPWVQSQQIPALKGRPKIREPKITPAAQVILSQREGSVRLSRDPRRKHESSPSFPSCTWERPCQRDSITPTYTLNETNP